MEVSYTPNQYPNGYELHKVKQELAGTKELYLQFEPRDCGLKLESLISPLLRMTQEIRATQKIYKAH